MSTILRKEAKKWFEKYFFKLINNALFEKTMGNVRNVGDIKLETTEARRDNLVLVSNYHTTTSFFRKFISHRNKKKQIFIKNQSIKIRNK